MLWCRVKVMIGAFVSSGRYEYREGAEETSLLRQAVAGPRCAVTMLCRA